MVTTRTIDKQILMKSMTNTKLNGADITNLTKFAHSQTNVTLLMRIMNSESQVTKSTQNWWRSQWSLNSIKTVTNRFNSDSRKEEGHPLRISTTIMEMEDRSFTTIMATTIIIDKTILEKILTTEITIQSTELSLAQTFLSVSISLLNLILVYRRRMQVRR